MTAAAHRPDYGVHAIVVKPEGAAARPTPPPPPPADLVAMARQAHRATVARLTTDLLEAVADDSSAVPEASRLHAWLSADFLPWCRVQEEAMPEGSARAAVRSDSGILLGLASLISGSSGEDAASWARQIHRTTLILLTRLDYVTD